MIREIGRILVSLALLALAFFLFKWAVGAQEVAQAGVAGAIVGALLTYWLKPEAA